MAVLASPAPAPEPAFRPRRVLAIELADPVGPIVPEPGPDGRPWPGAMALIRIHSWPLGLLELDLPDGALSSRDLCAAIEAAFGAVLARHLRADRLPVDWPLAPTGLPSGEAVACLEPRRALLAEAPPVTVVVPVADRPDLLRLCLADLEGQDYPDFEVVVVDNAPGRSGARSVLDEIDSSGRSRTWRCVDQPRAGSSIARNTGLDASTTSITAFVDADVRVDRHWLTELVRPLATDPGTACTTGLILPAELGTRAQAWLMEWGGYSKGFEPRRFDLDGPGDVGALYPFQPGLFGSGQSMAFRTSALKRIGGFDLALGVRTASQGGEELAAFLDLVLAGERLAYQPGAIVWHPDQADDAAFLAKLDSYAVGLTAMMTRTAARHPGTVLEIIRRLPAALRYFFDPGSAKNRRRSRSYPRRAVRLAELRGMAKGPFAYALARWRLRRGPARGGSASPQG